MNTKSDSSLNSASLSIRNQTKEKFEALLKAALTPKKRKSQEKLLLDEESYEMQEISGDSRNKNFILNKFFDESISQESGATYGLVNEIEEKPPIPKPRTRKNFNFRESAPSQKTLDVASPKSDVSNKTYDIEEIKEADSLSDYSRHTSSEETRKRSVDFDEIKELNSDKNLSKPPAPETKTEKTKYKYNKLTEIIIHKTERLLLNSMVVHPVVKIHIVNIETGKYFSKSDKTRAVVFFYENSENEYISPVMTHTFDLQENR